MSKLLLKISKHVPLQNINLILSFDLIILEHFLILNLNDLKGIQILSQQPKKDLR